MDSALKVTPSKLKKKAQAFQTDGKQFKSVTDSMFSLIEELNGKVWSGDAAKAYKAQFKELQDDATRLVSMVNEFSTDLTAVAAEYERAENANVQASKSLVKNVIS